jgi:hypothetical protein
MCPAGEPIFHVIDLEWWMVENGVVTTSDLEENPRASRSIDDNRRTATTIFRGSQMTAYGSDED